MRMQTQRLSAFIPITLLMALPGLALAQDAGMQAHGQDMGDMKFEQLPNLPSCSTLSVQQGDPAKGPSFIFAKTSTGCVFPWHWHTPNEHVMMVSGTASIDMHGGKPLTLHGGGFAFLPSKHVHRFTCTKTCALYVYSDTIFDIHYVDPQGKEIALDEALKQARAAAGKARK